ncbi:MAG: response regulator, partial [Gammaproteobacteria bacterium]
MTSHESPFPAADSGTRDAAAPADGSASGIRVLIVDDKPAPLEVLQGLMQRLGFAAQTALGGEAALRALRSEPFDLMLLDLVMPVVDGHAVLDFCQRHGLATRTIVLSGDDSFAATRHALQCGAFDFVRKPYAVSALLATVERAVQQTELERENRRIASRLRDSEALHRFIVNSSPDLVYMVDRDGCFTFLNDRVESLLGYPKEALLGVRCDTLADAADRELARYVLNERRTGECASTNVEMRLCPRAAPGTPAAYSGASIWVEVTATGVYREAARGERLAYTGTYGTIRDITER